MTRLIDRLAWILDEYLNHRLLGRWYIRRICDWNDRRILDGTE